MDITLHEISEIFPSYQGHVAHTIIKGVFSDSRKETNKGLFVPIIGDKFDGHDFLKEAINQGAIAALWQKSKQVPSFVPNDFPLFFTDDTIVGLQNIAKMYLHKIKPVVVGITGSNGKTTTKDLVGAVIAQKYRTHQTKGNLNNHIGLPLTILMMPHDTEVLILEMGMNHFGEISALSQLAEPDYAIITNIGESHIEFLGSRAGIAKAKLEIADGLKETGKLIIDGDEPLLTNKLPADQVISCGMGKHNDWQLTSIFLSEQGLQFTVNSSADPYVLAMLGKFNAKNATFALAIARELRMTDEQIRTGFAQIDMTGMRLEKTQGLNGSLFINDAYNASPTSMRAAIETLKSFSQYERKIVVLGDMYELGNQEESLHRGVAFEIDSPITDVITIGTKAGWIADEVKKTKSDLNIYQFAGKDEAKEVLEQVLNKNTVVLFKASRGARLETLIQSLRKV